MAKHYKILEKAKLARDLFGGDDDWQVDVAPEEGDPPKNPAGDDLFADPASASELAEPETGVETAPQLDPAELWNVQLAEAANAPGLGDCKALGVCPVRGMPGAAALAATLAQWAADRSNSPVLLIEGNGRFPRMSKLLQGRQRGLTEVLFGGMAFEEAVTEWEGERLRLLPLGRSIDWRRRRAMRSGLPAVVADARRAYESVIVELPGADDRLLKKLPVSEMVDATVLVADTTQTVREIERAAGILRLLGAPAEACLLGGPSRAGRATRLDRLERQLRAGGRRRRRSR